MDLTVSSLRPMTPADVAAVAELERASFDDPWPPSAFLEELALESRSYLVVARDGAIVGFGGLMMVDGDAHITTIAVAAAHRGRGDGTRLLLGLIEEARRRAATSLTLEVRASNEAAAALYRKFGFVPVGVRPSYYGTEDALVMWVTDADSDEYRLRLEAVRESLG